MAEKYRFHQYDNGIKLVFPISKSGLVETIQGAQIQFRFFHVDKPDIKYDRACTITDAEAGECQYVLTRTDLSVPGNYVVEVETTYPNGTVLSVENPFTFVVLPQRI